MNNRGSVLSFLIIVLALVLAGAGGYVYYKNQNPEQQDETFVVKKGDINEEIAVTGRVQAVNDLTLAFDRSGRIRQVHVKVGDSVSANDPLVTLDTDDIRAQLLQAQAQVSTEEANLADMRRGATAENLAVAQSKADGAKVSLDSSVSLLKDSLVQAYTDVDNIVHNTLDPIFNNDNSPTSVALNFQATDGQVKINILRERASIEGSISDWKKRAANHYSGDLTSDDIATAEKNVSDCQQLLNDITTSLLSTSFDDWKTAVSLARTRLSQTASGITTSKKDYFDAKAAVLVAQNELTVAKTGSSVEALAAQNARIDQAQAKVLEYQTAINKATLRAPINAIITKVDGKVGEIAYANTALVSLISNGNFEIETNVPELDIAHVKVGNPARITLDAYGPSVEFPAAVSSVDPAETIVDNIPKYKVKLLFKDNDPRIKSGLTANVFVTTDKKEGVVYVPARAILSNGATKYVLVKKLGLNEKRTVTIGIRGNSGEVEILSGLDVGETIVIPNAETER